MKTVQNNEFSDDFNYSSKQSHAKTLELVILAIVAAFFVSLGNNLGRIIGTSWSGIIFDDFDMDYFAIRRLFTCIIICFDVV